MLVLTRMRDESIMIGDDIEVQVVDIRSDKIRLRIVAPKHISIHRKELYDVIKLENLKRPPVIEGDASVAQKRDGGGGLVLSRERGQIIMIGDDIEVMIVDIRGDNVRIGTTAPKNIKVHRLEVYEDIQRENKEAARKRPFDAAALSTPKK